MVPAITAGTGEWQRYQKMRGQHSILSNDSSANPDIFHTIFRNDARKGDPFTAFSVDWKNMPATQSTPCSRRQNRSTGDHRPEIRFLYANPRHSIFLMVYSLNASLQRSFFMKHGTASLLILLMSLSLSARTNHSGNIESISLEKSETSFNAGKDIPLRPVALTQDPAPRTLPPAGYNKVAYYAFDATPVDQDILPLTSFTGNANIVIVFEGTLWELADTVHYSTGAMHNKIYTSKKQILDDIQALRNRGIFVLMNLDDAASWSTATPFTTWNKKALDCRQFAAFVDSCITVAGFDGISLDVEHKAVDNTDYRNLIKELGRYFGPLSSAATSKIYTGAFYTSQFTAPGTIFRDSSLGRYLNFIMDMGYSHDNDERFAYWTAGLGNSKVMNGMSHQYNDLKSAVSWASWHPVPEKAGVMVFAANVNKHYTDTIFTALGNPVVRSVSPASTVSNRPPCIDLSEQMYLCEFSLPSAGTVSLRVFLMNGRVCATVFEDRYETGTHIVRRSRHVASPAPGIYTAILEVNGRVLASRRFVQRLR